MYSCPFCKKELVIELFPDFSSSGMWCKACGINFSNPKKTFKKVPLGLIDLVIIWNDYWDNTVSNIGKDSIFFEQLQTKFNSAGYFLAEKIGQYYPCEFSEEKSEIYSLKEQFYE
jgi:hypothetical protein